MNKSIRNDITLQPRTTESLRYINNHGTSPIPYNQIESKLPEQGSITKEKLPNVGLVYSNKTIFAFCFIYVLFSFYRDLPTKGTPQLKDFLTNNLQAYGGYMTSVECDPTSLHAPRHSQITQQYSSSTDEGCDTDHGEMDDVIQSSVPPSIQRLNSYASSSSSSGVVTNFHSKSLSQNLSCESSRSNFSTFESLDLNLSDCSDLAASLPSCATSTALAITDNIKENGKHAIVIA